MKLPRRRSISAEELLLLSFAGPVLFCQEYALFFASWPAPKCHKWGQLGRKIRISPSNAQIQPMLTKAEGFYSPLKAPFDGIKRLQDISACSEKVDYQGFVGTHENADRRHPPEASETRAKKKKPQTKKPRPEQPGLISQLTPLGAGGLAR